MYNSFIIKGNVCQTINPKELDLHENAFVVCVNGVSKGIFNTRTATFRMADKGVPFDPLKKPEPDITLSAEEREIGGLGIFITKKTMDLVTYAYENGENILTMIKKI